ncbi:MAG TPA: hypothetical protein VFV32_02265 [Acidimicrobiales bacterium]|nr:hypothetical protein [Acidimicrobiales bacterium]
MTTDEPARLHLYELARDALDESAADTLMNGLGGEPVGITGHKEDLASLG